MWWRSNRRTGSTPLAAGAMLTVPAACPPSYGVTLFALFVIASGITLPQLSAYPYVAVVGARETASAPLDPVQAFNSLGTTPAPLIGAYLILGRLATGTAQAGAVLIVASVPVLLAIAIARFPLPALLASTRRARKEERATLSP